MKFNSLPEQYRHHGEEVLGQSTKTRFALTWKIAWFSYKQVTLGYSADSWSIWIDFEEEFWKEKVWTSNCLLIFTW